MKIQVLIAALLIFITNSVWSQSTDADKFQTNEGIVKIQPILHGSLVISYQNKTIYIDPYGGAHLYKGLPAPDIILITDIHGDHLHQKTLDSLDTSNSIFIVPKAVSEKLSESMKAKSTILNNGQGIHRFDIFIKAIPMYNLPGESDSKHVKGRGNGYLLHIADKRIYISGDTEDIQEMRALQNIDIAFVCMNLPYTMDIHQAASAVLEFQPKIVYPYHYRGRPNMSNTEEFKKLVNSKNKEIEVRLRNWYPAN